MGLLNPRNADLGFAKKASPKVISKGRMLTKQSGGSRSFTMDPNSLNALIGKVPTKMRKD